MWDMFSKEQIIDARKQYSKLSSESRKNAKLDSCLYCGKKVKGFCNSHSVPQLVLKNIDKQGKVDYFNTLFQIPIINDDLGVNEAGTFHLICNDCDSHIFSDYEDEGKLAQYPTQNMLAEIALKNYLVFLGKRYYEIELYANMKQTFSVPLPYNAKECVNNLDLGDYQWHYERVKDMLTEKTDAKMHIMFWVKLDYVVPIAYQGAVTLYCDLQGNLINDIYDASPEIRMKDLHIAIFPLQQESIVLAFYDERDKEFNRFETQFNLLSETEKLDLIHFIIIKYSDAIFISKDMQLSESEMKRLKIVASSTNELVALSIDELEKLKEKARNGLVKRKKIPNLLSEEYKLK